jgi:hypothetical protein
MHRGSQPIEFVRERSIVDFGHRWPSGDDAQRVDKVSAEKSALISTSTPSSS